MVGLGWGTAQLIIDNDTADATHPRISTDALGNSMVAWGQFDGGNQSVWTNRFVAGYGWTLPEQLTVGSGSFINGIRVAVGASGDSAIVGWSEYDWTVWSVRTSRWTPVLGWGPAETIAAVGGEAASTEDVAVDGLGNSFVVWEQRGDPWGNIWGIRFSAGVPPVPEFAAFSLVVPSIVLAHFAARSFRKRDDD